MSEYLCLYYSTEVQALTQTETIYSISSTHHLSLKC